MFADFPHIYFSAEWRVHFDAGFETVCRGCQRNEAIAIDSACENFAVSDEIRKDSLATQDDCSCATSIGYQNMVAARYHEGVAGCEGDAPHQSAVSIDGSDFLIGIDEQEVAKNGIIMLDSGICAVDGIAAAEGFGGGRKKHITIMEYSKSEKDDYRKYAEPFQQGDSPPLGIL